jgi:MinD-like ATPase involved in chromosome partitioning or flagellar assembly
MRVAIVSRDPVLRLEAARAFDAAPPAWIVSLHTRSPSDADVVVATPDVDVPGAIPFDPSHPEGVLGAVSARTEIERAHIVVVTSPSGGTGATSVALHLAAAAAARHRTCFIDLDLRWGVMDRLGLPDDVRTWEAGVHSSDDVVRAAIPVQGGFRALLVHENGHGAAAIDAARSEFERVFVDAPVEVLSADVLERASAGVLVLSPTVPSACRARRMLDALTTVEWAVVTNRLGPGGEMTRSGLERILERSVALELPCVPALRDAEDDARLVTSSFSRWLRAIDRLFKALESV